MFLKHEAVEFNKYLQKHYPLNKKIYVRYHNVEALKFSLIMYDGYPHKESRGMFSVRKGVATIHVACDRPNPEAMWLLFAHEYGHAHQYANHYEEKKTQTIGQCENYANRFAIKVVNEYCKHKGVAPLFKYQK